MVMRGGGEHRETMNGVSKAQNQERRQGETESNFLVLFIAHLPLCLISHLLPFGLNTFFLPQELFHY